MVCGGPRSSHHSDRPPDHSDCHDGECLQCGGRGSGEIFQHLQTFQSKLGRNHSDSDTPDQILSGETFTPDILGLTFYFLTFLVL